MYNIYIDIFYVIFSKKYIIKNNLIADQIIKSINFVIEEKMSLKFTSKNQNFLNCQHFQNT